MNAVLFISGMMWVIGTVLILINAFRTSLLWGLGSLFISPVLLLYIALHWEENKKPFLLVVGGFVLLVVMAIALGTPAATTPPV